MTTEEKIERLEQRMDRLEAKYKTMRGYFMTTLKTIDGMLDLQDLHEDALERLEAKEAAPCEI